MFADLIWAVLTTVFYGLVIAYFVAVIPAMVLMGLRQHWAYFAAGFVTFGLAWFLGAFQVLDIRKRSILIGVGVVVLIGFLAARPALLVGVDGKSLQNSVDRLFAENSQCRQAGDVWICGRFDSALSGDREYRIDVDWMGCWQGEAVTYRWEGEGSIENPAIEGCMTLKDYI